MGGVDKPLLRLGHHTLLDHILAALNPGHRPIAISANGDLARFAAFGLAVLADPIPGQGPLGGLLAGLEWAAASGERTLLTVPGDTPLIPSGLGYTLAPGPSVAESNGRRHHLVALWPVSAAPSLRAWLQQPGPRSVRAFAETLPMRPVAFSGNPFVNVNTPADLAALEAEVSHTGM